MNPKEASSVTVSPSQALNIVIVYDEFLSGQHAVQTCQRLILQQGEPVDVQVKTWTFDLLRNHQLNSAAVRDAAEAEVIILAAASQQVPPQVERWLEAWRSRPGNGRASLVAVLDSPAREESKRSPLEDYLKRFASSTGSNLQIEKTV